MRLFKICVAVTAVIVTAGLVQDDFELFETPKTHRSL